MAPRTADLFERLRRLRPGMTDPHSGSLPALRHALLWTAIDGGCLASR